MSESPLQRTEALRDELFGDLQESDLFKATQALDDAVFALGGQRRLPRKGGVSITSALSQKNFPEPTPANGNSARLTQPEAAEATLREVGRPLTIRDLLPLIIEKGVALTATDPVASLGSQLSRNPDRFVSRKVDGQYQWWVKSIPWPEEDGTPDLLREKQG